jgi:hypothetical protein
MRKDVHLAKVDDDADPSMLLAEIELDGAQPALEAASPIPAAALAGARNDHDVHYAARARARVADQRGEGQRLS